MDITRNLFYWFRGPSGGGDPASCRQLENNLTKSFISILEQCDRQLVLGGLLKKLGLRPSKDVVFSLQRKPPLAGATKRNIVLAITGGEGEQTAGRRRINAGRPDGWICGSNWTILIESKIGAKITKSQLDAHARAAGWRRGSYRLRSLTWSELHRMCKNALSRVPSRDKTTKLLLEHWLPYLEYQNMAEFERLEPKDFDVFNLPDEERRAMLSHMRRRLHAFAELVGTCAPAKKIARLYKQKRPEEWKFGEPSATGRGCWFNIGGDPSAQEWHATVFLRANEISVCVLNSRNHLIRKLCRSGVDVFANIIDMTRKWDGFCLSCRRAWYANPNSPYKGQKIGRADDPLVVMPAALPEGSLYACATMIKSTLERFLRDKRWRTELQIRQEIPREKIVRLSAKRQLAALARPLKRLQRVLNLLTET